MRTPVPNVEPATITLPVATRRLTEPDAKFIDDLCIAIRAGARAQTASAWLGCSKTQWKRWKERTGGMYDELRTRVAQARAHVEVRLQSELAKRSPGAALRELKRTRAERDDEPDDEARRYDRSGYMTISRAVPHLLKRISDDEVTDLTPVESAAKEFREGVIADCGGRAALTHTKLALISSATGSWIILNTLDRFVLDLAQTQGLTSRRHKRVWPVVEARGRLAEGFARTLALIGLEKRAPERSLSEIIEQEKTRTNGNGDH
jgi:hypothetical protein